MSIIGDHGSVDLFRLKKKKTYKVNLWSLSSNYAFKSLKTVFKLTCWDQNLYFPFCFPTAWLNKQMCSEIFISFVISLFLFSFPPLFPTGNAASSSYSSGPQSLVSGPASRPKVTLRTPSSFLGPLPLHAGTQLEGLGWSPGMERKETNRIG